jgi:hypothetical protein
VDKISERTAYVSVLWTVHENDELITYFEDFRLLTLFLGYFSLLGMQISRCIMIPSKS